MTQTVLTVTYGLRGDIASFRKSMADPAGAIRATDGLLWKIWAIDDQASRGLSVYLFTDDSSAGIFAAGAMIAGLRAHPDVTDVMLTRAPVDRALSILSGAEGALAPSAHCDAVES